MVKDDMRDAFFHAQEHIRNRGRKKHGQYDRRFDTSYAHDAARYAYGGRTQGKTEAMKFAPLMALPLKPGQMGILTPDGDIHILDKSEWAVV